MGRPYRNEAALTAELRAAVDVNQAVGVPILGDEEAERRRRIDVLVENLDAELADLREERRITSENLSEDSKDKATRAKVATASGLAAKQRASALALRQARRATKRR